MQDGPYFAMSGLLSGSRTRLLVLGFLGTVVRCSLPVSVRS